MQLQRVASGEYLVTNGERAVGITKGLGGDWQVIPKSGVDSESRSAPSYADAKLIAQWMIRTTQSNTPRGEAARVGEVSRKAADALVKAEASKLMTLAERLRKIADELAN